MNQTRKRENVFYASRRKTQEKGSITQMKKLMVAVIALVMVLAICATSYATTFTKTVQCRNENDYVRSELSEEKEWDDFRIYVYHNAQGCSNRYTNHFRGYHEDGWLDGSKWVTPGLQIPIQGAGFTIGWRYYLTMRGNTKYKNEGLSRITLAGYFVTDYFKLP